jgi:hypothetical protein
LLGDINTGPWSSRLGAGHKAEKLCEKIIVAKSEEMKAA